MGFDTLMDMVLCCCSNSKDVSPEKRKHRSRARVLWRLVGSRSVVLNTVLRKAGSFGRRSDVEHGHPKNIYPNFRQLALTFITNEPVGQKASRRRTSRPLTVTRRQILEVVT